MTNILYKNLICISVILSFSSCEDILTENPGSYYEKSEFFTSEANAKMGIIGIYNVLPLL